MDSPKDSLWQLQLDEIVSPSLIKRPPANMNWNDYSKFDLGLGPEWKWPVLPPQQLNSAQETGCSSGCSESSGRLRPSFSLINNKSEYSTFDLGKDPKWEWIPSQPDILDKFNECMKDAEKEFEELGDCLKEPEMKKQCRLSLSRNKASKEGHSDHDIRVAKNITNKSNAFADVNTIVTRKK